MRVLLFVLASVQVACASLPVVKENALAGARSLSSRASYLEAANVVREARKKYLFEDHDISELQRVEAAYRHRAELAQASAKSPAARELVLDLLFANGALERAEPGDVRVPALLEAWGREAPAATTFFTHREVDLLAEGDGQNPAFRAELTRELGVVGMVVKAGGADSLRLRFVRAGSKATTIFGNAGVACTLKVEAEWTSGGALLSPAFVERRDFAHTEDGCYASAAGAIAPVLFRALIPGARTER